MLKLSDLTFRALVKILLFFTVFSLVLLVTASTKAESREMLIDDFSNKNLVSKLNTQWRGVTDKVMGGITQASVLHDVIGERNSMRITGHVRLENNGGFLQAVLPLNSDKSSFDAAVFKGIRILVRGNKEQYSIHLRTVDNQRPWQSYRAHFIAGAEWESIDIPFTEFTPHRLTKPINTKYLRRIGLVAIGRSFYADLSITTLSFYK